VELIAQETFPYFSKRMAPAHELSFARPLARNRVGFGNKRSKLWVIFNRREESGTLAILSFQLSPGNSDSKGARLPVTGASVFPGLLASVACE